MTIRQITIEHAPNGYVVTESFGSHQLNKVLAVFNHMPDLTAWLAANFQLPDPEPTKEGGAA